MSYSGLEGELKTAVAAMAANQATQTTAFGTVKTQLDAIQATIDSGTFDTLAAPKVALQASITAAQAGVTAGLAAGVSHKAKTDAVAV